MDNIAFIKTLGIKTPREMVDSFSTNIAIHNIITTLDINAEVAIKTIKSDKVTYSVTPKDEYSKQYVETRLKEEKAVIHGHQYKLKTSKSRVKDVTLVELRAF